jgi:hypothetical protein
MGILQADLYNAEMLVVIYTSATSRIDLLHERLCMAALSEFTVNVFFFQKRVIIYLRVIIT